MNADILTLPAPQETPIAPSDAANDGFRRIQVAERAAFGRGAERRIKQLTAKVREAERRRDTAIRDLVDTVGICKQLLARCKDRLDTQDQVAILDGLLAIQKEHNAGH